MTTFGDDLIQSLNEALAHAKGEGPAIVHAQTDTQSLSDVRDSNDVATKKIVSITVEQTTRTMHYWATRPLIQKHTTDKMLLSEVLLVPWESRLGDKEKRDIFPAGTSDFYRRFSKSFEMGMVALATEPENYQELSLRADHIRWPTMAMKAIAFGVVAGVIGNEITNLIHQPDSPKTLEMALIVENSSGICISIKYEGPPLRALDMIVREVRTCFPDEINHSITEESGQISEDVHSHHKTK